MVSAARLITLSGDDKNITNTIKSDCILHPHPNRPLIIEKAFHELLGIVRQVLTNGDFI